MPDQPGYPGAPRWVKISGIVVAILALLLAGVIVTDLGGPHGPGRHMPTAGGSTGAGSHEGGDQ